MPENNQTDRGGDMADTGGKEGWRLRGGGNGGHLVESNSPVNPTPAQANSTPDFSMNSQAVGFIRKKLLVK